MQSSLKPTFCQSVTLADIVFMPSWYLIRNVSHDQRIDQSATSYSVCKFKTSVRRATFLMTLYVRSALWTLTIYNPLLNQHFSETGCQKVWRWCQLKFLSRINLPLVADLEIFVNDTFQSDIIVSTNKSFHSNRWLNFNPLKNVNTVKTKFQKCRTGHK